MAVDTATRGWSPERAADVLGVTPDHVRLLCRRGQLAAVTERGLWFIDPDSVRQRVAARSLARSLAERKADGDG